MYVLVSMKSLHPHYEIYRTVICSILPLNYLDRVSVYICQVTDKSLHNETRLSRCLDQSFYSCTNILTKKHALLRVCWWAVWMKCPRQSLSFRSSFRALGESHSVLFPRRTDLIANSQCLLCSRNLANSLGFTVVKRLCLSEAYEVIQFW